MNEQTIQEVRKRAARYPYEDGTIEIGQGAVYTILGILIWVADIIITGGEGKWLYALGVIAFSLVASVLVGYFVKRYKQRVTYPRSGHVKYERPASKELRDAALLILLALGVAAGSIFLDGWYASPTVSVGAVITMIFFFSGLRASLTRMQVLAFVSLFIALVASYFGLDVTIGSALAIGGLGVVTLLAGLYAMRIYLKNNPEPSQEEA